jgi:hypothetical protein
VIFKGLTISGGGNVGSGGGILNAGKLSLSACKIMGNKVNWDSGGILNVGTGNLIIKDATIVSFNVATDGGGGGIYNYGSLTINNSKISGNRSLHNDGGGIANAGKLTISGSSLLGNSAPGSGGGALINHHEGVATIQKNTKVYDNTSGTGALFNYGILKVIDSTVSKNNAVYGGGLSNWGGTLTITNTTVSGNSASASAGGIHNKDGGTTTIKNNSLISENTATWDGGGINNWDGTVNIVGSTVSENSALQSGGGVLNLPLGTIITNSQYHYPKHCQRRRRCCQLGWYRDSCQ